MKSFTAYCDDSAKTQGKKKKKGKPTVTSRTASSLQVRYLRCLLKMGRAGPRPWLGLLLARLCQGHGGAGDDKPLVQTAARQQNGPAQRRRSPQELCPQSHESHSPGPAAPARGPSVPVSKRGCSSSPRARRSLSYTAARLLLTASL